MIFGPKINKNGKNWQNENFPKNGVWASLYPLSLCEISKKSNEPIYSNIQKSCFFPTAPPTFAPFCPFFVGNGHFSRKVTTSS